MIKLSTQCSKVYACYVWKHWEIWLQNYKMDTKTMQCMWILNTNDAWKKNCGKKYRNWKFFNCDRSRIDRTSIESGRLKPKILIAISIDQKIGSINRKSRKIRFLKNWAFYNAETPQSTLFYKKKKCMSMRRKVFQKHLNSIKIFQN